MMGKMLIKCGLMSAFVALIAADVAAQAQGKKPNIATMTPDDGVGGMYDLSTGEVHFLINRTKSTK